MITYDHYKQVNAGWIAEIPFHWEATAVKFVCTFNDEVLPETFDPEALIDYVEISDVDESRGLKSSELMPYKAAPSRARRIVRDGDVIISTVRTYLRAVAPITSPPENLVVSTGFAVIRPERLTSGFARYALVAEGFVGSVIARSTGVSYPAINANDLVRIPVPVPPLDEQIAIAAYLDAETKRIDELIEQKKLLLAALTELRQSAIDDAISLGINSAVEMKEAGMPWLEKIPKHWNVVQLRHVLDELAKNGIFKKSDDFGEGTLLVNVSDLFSESFEIDPERLQRVRCTEEEIEKYRVQCGDLFLVRSSLKLEGIARFAIAQKVYEPTVFECHVVRLRPDLNLVDPDFLVKFLNSSIAKASLISRAKTTTMTTIDQGEILATKVILPPIDEQRVLVEEINDRTKRVDEIVVHTKQEISLLVALRSATITDAVLGRIDVRKTQTH